LGGFSGAERGTREPGGAIRTGIIAAAITFHQQTRDVSSDLLVDVEGTRRYLRSCVFTVAQSEEIIAEARSDQPSTTRTQDMVITSFRQHALQGFLRRWPMQRASDRGDTAEEAVRARTTDAREASAGSYDGNPRVGVRTGARHEDGRYTDIFVSRYPCPLDAGGFNEPNKTVVK